MTSAAKAPPPETAADANPEIAVPVPDAMLEGQRTSVQHFVIYLFVIVPMLAFAAAIPVAWGWGVHWHDLGMMVGFYVVGCLGITVGYHRHFTHRSFKARPWLRVALAISGSLAVQGSVLHWVADHRRHHAFSDKEGDPHSPWLFGTSPRAVAKGFIHAHFGWLFDRRETNYKRFVPDLLADRSIMRVDRNFGWLALVSLALPAVVGALVTRSWLGALTAFFWAGLVRMGALHHVTWSINSICHMIGRRPFASRDQARNFWPLAILSMGESWHNLHHADPTCARHGVLRGQIDISARLIWIFERFGWASNVRWPTQARLARLRQS